VTTRAPALGLVALDLANRGVVVERTEQASVNVRTRASSRRGRVRVQREERETLASRPTYLEIGDILHVGAELLHDRQVINEEVAGSRSRLADGDKRGRCTRSTRSGNRAGV